MRYRLRARCQLLLDDAWPELLPFMFQSITSDNPRLQESALLVFSQLAHYIGDILLPHLPTLHSVLLSSLSHPTSADVRIAALGAAINIVQCLSSVANRDRFGDLLPAMMRTLTESLNSSLEATAQEELAGPALLTPQTYGSIIHALLQKSRPGDWWSSSF